MPLRKLTGNTQLIVQEDGNGGHLLGVSPGDGPVIDAFDRQRVSNPTGLFASKLQYDNNPLWWNQKITNTSGNATAAHDDDASSVVFTCEAEDQIIRQSKTYHNYQPGKSQLVLMTFVLGVATAGVTRSVGYYDANDGIFLKQDGDGIYIVVRSSTGGTPDDTEIEQSDWNIDKLDGTGSSRETIDLSKAQILIIDFEWLGVGRVRVGFVIDGEIIYVHQFLNANAVANVYMKTPNLPTRYELSVGAGTAGAHTMRQICSAVMSEGGAEKDWGHAFCATNGATLRTISTTRVPLVSIRPKQTFNGIGNRMQIGLDSVSMFSEDSPAFVEFVYGGSINNASWKSTHEHSGVEYDVSASTITGGISFDSAYIATGQGGASGDLSKSKSLGLPLALDIDGNHPSSSPTDVLSIVAVRIGNSNTDMSATIAWEEIR